MIGSKEQPKKRSGFHIEVGGEIGLPNSTGDKNNSTRDVMVGAYLEKLHGDTSDLSWADVIRHLRNHGVTFKIFDE